MYLDFNEESVTAYLEPDDNGIVVAKPEPGQLYRCTHCGLLMGKQALKAHVERIFDEEENQ